ncbi:MAG: hypothetical protein PHH54_05815 [Candidatus Nanoarchaeia archaeon]|nr:hypothetical protein [Candidatus Nanoarchaeia archaeon]MDD5741472.1 hypothetical protein [Candidatus Nanoarchaeia archaeon]
MPHEYTSSEYLAQSFQSFVISELPLRYHIDKERLKEVVRSGKYVTFPFIQKSQIKVGFDSASPNDTCKVSLEIKLENIWNGPIEKEIFILRSRTGKVSVNLYKKLMKTFVVNNFGRLAGII